MKFLAIACGLLQFPMAVLSAVESPALSEPVDGAKFMNGIPRFQWRHFPDVKPEAMPSCDIEIATDRDFSRILDSDRLAAVIDWYVPDKELAPGDYWWRVAEVDAQGARGPWSDVRRFSIRLPERVFEVSRGATFADIQRVFSDAATHSPAVVKFEKADYRLDPAGNAAFIDLTNVNDLVIDGAGANITFTGFLTFVELAHCRRILVKNFTFDFDPLPYSAGRVLAVDPTAGTFDVEIAPGHPLPETNPAFERDRKGMIVDPAYPRMKKGVGLVFEHAGWKKLGERLYRFAAANPAQLRELSPGDVYVLDPRIVTGFDVDASDDITLLNLTAHSVANEAFNSHYASRLSILHCGIRLKPGRFLASNNGGHNHHNARIGPWIEGGAWENTGDDICHVNGLVMGVEEKITPDRVRLPLNNPYDAVGASLALDIQPGDVLQFFNRAEGRLISERSVIRTARLKKSLDVTLDGDVGDITPGRPGVKRIGVKKALSDEAITQVFDASRTCNQFVFRNNTIRNGRRIGVLAKGLGGLIENNIFEGLGGGAVEFWNAPFEGLGATDYVVCVNLIRDCGLLSRDDAAIWATIFKTGGDKLHRNLLIADNDIAGFSGPAILLNDTENAVVSGNRISLPPQPAGKSHVEPIILRNTRAVQVGSNPVSEARP